MKQINEAVPGTRLVQLDGAGHISNMEQPAAFTKAIADFVKG
jgi:3-oxoadipate enol-lactonase